MRILVAGGHGQVGSALSQLGEKQGLDIIALDRSQLDITDPSSISDVFRIHRPALLINAAAFTAVDDAESMIEQAYAINEVGTCLLADACASSAIPMLHISTDYVFDGLKETPYTEEDPVNPISVYGKTKEAGERALRARHQHHIVVRTSWVFGDQGNNFVKTIVRLAQEKKELAVVADQFGGPTSARSIAKKLLVMAEFYKEHKTLPWGTYHFCQQPYVSWHQFSETIIEHAKKKGIVKGPIKLSGVQSREYPSRSPRPKNSKLSTDKIKRQFGFHDDRWEEDLLALLSKLK